MVPNPFRQALPIEIILLLTMQTIVDKIIHCLVITMLLLVISSVHHSAIGQVNSSKSVINGSSDIKPFIRKFDTLINVKINFNTDFERFIIKSNQYNIDLRPNIAISNRVYFSYRYISFTFGFRLRFLPFNNDDDLQGKTDAWSVGVSMNSRWIQDLNLGYIKGFYLKNMAGFDVDWIEGKDPYLQFPETIISYLNGQTGYKFNPHFSLKAIHSQSEKQLRNAGSFIPVLSYDFYVFDNENEANQTSSQQSANLRMILNPGYAYTFVLRKHFYLSIHLSPGIGFQHTQLLTRTTAGDLTNRYTDAVYRLAERVGIGYQGRRFFAGSEVLFSQLSQRVNHSGMHQSANRTYFQIFAGYRFNAPRFLKKATDEAKELVPAPIQNILE